MIDDFAVLVVSCDAYVDVLNNFPAILKKYWHGFSQKCYFILEENDFKTNCIDNYETIMTGKMQYWSERLVYALNSVKEKYILFMLEDYYLGKEVQNMDFQNIVDLLKQEAISFYDLRNKPRTKGKRYNGHACYIKNIRYGMSLQASIWEKDFLLDIIRNKQFSAWQVEEFFNSLCEKRKTATIPNSLIDTRNLLNIQNGVIQGKWNPDTIKFFKDQNYYLDTSKRKVVPKKTMLKYKFINILYIILPNKLVTFIKKMAKRMGFKFVTK